MTGLWQRLRTRLNRHSTDGPGRPIPEDLWKATIDQYSFVQGLAASDLLRLRHISQQFLMSKEFHGAGGMVISDEVAVTIAIQACMPLLRVDAGLGHAATLRSSALDWYSDFVGIVVHPGEVLARREVVDELGVVHRYDEVIAGEAMAQGPVMLSWSGVAEAAESGDQGYNLVIHEFMHKIDMADGAADGCPPLGRDFMGASSTGAARQLWFAAWEPAYQAFREQVIIADRFGGEPPWLDAYGAEGIDEFFAVAGEAYFVNRARFSQEFASLLPTLDAFFGAATVG